jgi:hypothetical protein
MSLELKRSQELKEVITDQEIAGTIEAVLAFMKENAIGKMVQTKMENKITADVDEIAADVDEKTTEDKDDDDYIPPLIQLIAWMRDLNDETQVKLASTLLILIFVIAGYCTSPSHRQSRSYSPISTQNTLQTTQVTIGIDQTTGLRQRNFPAERERYEHIYFRGNELNSNPGMLITFANWWMVGEYLPSDRQGCFGDPVNRVEMQVATWFYPCGSKLLICNPLTDQCVEVEVTDRGPNRLLTDIDGYEDDRVRFFGMDISEAAANKIDHLPGGKLVVVPIAIPGIGDLDEDNMPGLVVDLLQSPPYYTGIDLMTGAFIGGS